MRNKAGTSNKGRHMPLSLGCHGMDLHQFPLVMSVFNDVFSFSSSILALLFGELATSPRDCYSLPVAEIAILKRYTVWLLLFSLV